METFIILLCITLIIICLRVIREVYVNQPKLSMYVRPFDVNIRDGDDAYKKYVYNSLRVQ